MARYRVGLETRGRILEATRELLAEQGAAELTLKAITDRARVGAGSFYNLFDSKEAVVLEVVRDAIEAVDPDPSGVGRERVDDLVDALVTFFVDPRTAVAARIYLQLAFAGALQDEAMAARVRRHHTARVARFAAALRREDPDLDEEAARTAAEQLLAAVMGVCLVWMLDPDIDLRSRAHELTDALRAGPAGDGIEGTPPRSVPSTGGPVVVVAHERHRWAPGFALLLVAVLIAANGVFVAFEFGLVASRRGVLEEAAAAGDRGAAAAVKQLDNVSFVLSTAQFGITATSLIVGFLAEDAVGETLVAPLLELLGLPPGSRTGVTIAIAFALSTVVQMLLGELGPKNLALAIPERTSAVLAIPVRVFSVVLGPVIRLFDASAAFTTERVFGTEVAEERLTGYDADELTQIIAASRDAEQLTDHQGELLTRAVVLGDRRAHEIMVPRTQVVYLEADDSLDDLRTAARHTGHSRFPVRGVDDDDVVGTVHIKDVLSVAPSERATTRLGAIAAPAVLVPESEPLRRLLARLRRAQRTFAMVIDEYGGVAGIVTVEDVVEELVGEIEDEFDTVAGPVRRVGPERWLFDGTVRIDHVTDVLNWEVPSGEYETVAGFVIDRLGRLPNTGSSVRLDGWEFVAQRVDGVRLAQVLVRRAEDQA